MKKGSLFFCCLRGMILCYCSSLTADEEATTPPPPSSSASLPLIRPSEQDSLRSFVKGINHFAFDCYQKLKSRRGNLCFSPYSISSGLAILASGAHGETSREMQDTLHYASGLLPLAGDLSAALLAPPAANDKTASQLLLGNTLWLEQGLPLLPFFEKTMERDFQGAIKHIDFSRNPTNSIQEINQWVSEQTRRKINQVVNEQDVDNQTRLLLTAAIYMKGQWTHLFDLKQTKRAPFYIIPQHSVQVEMMQVTENYTYMQDDTLDLINLPYLPGQQGTRLILTVLLPKAQMLLEELEQMLTEEIWQKWQEQVQEKRIALSLPRFRVEQRFDLEPTLKALGMKQAFSPAADFSGITGRKDLFINNVVHKTFVRVDEKGTEATAVTAIGMRPTAISEQGSPLNFVVNRPFLFVIWDQQTGTLLFLGRVTQP